MAFVIVEVHGDDDDIDEGGLAAPGDAGGVRPKSDNDVQSRSSFKAVIPCSSDKRMNDMATI